MAVKIRLKRMGKIRAPYYRIVVADSRTKRDGRVIEEIGKYHPTENPSVIEITSDRALYWLGVGAQPTEQVTALLKLTGDWGTFKGEKGAKNTVKLAEAKPEFQADEKKKPVLKPKAEAPAKAEKAEKTDKADKSAKTESTDVDAPAAEKPAADAPVAEKPAAEKPAADDATEAPAEDAPAKAAKAEADDADKA
ncbi:MAG: 30S ribosomal protein S16 [Microbacteriaceae bacterium]|nr:30S ribosomal protein S16 [Microbacteriaceae bacterium]